MVLALRIYSLGQGQPRIFCSAVLSKNGNAAQLVTDRELEVSPLDHAEGRSVRLAVIGLNITRPLNQVRNEAARLMAAWLQGDAR